mmetsp:Transcript_57543/g.161427  ORF Transcript_57543/g.161427 Transcript_57543/m.161427 type:complete len:435 (-) Transcript_57543:245-1549(-)
MQKYRGARRDLADGHCGGHCAFRNVPTKPPGGARGFATPPIAKVGTGFPGTTTVRECIGDDPRAAALAMRGIGAPQSAGGAAMAGVAAPSWRTMVHLGVTRAPSSLAGLTTSTLPADGASFSKQDLIDSWSCVFMPFRCEVSACKRAITSLSSCESFDSKRWSARRSASICGSQKSAPTLALQSFSTAWSRSASSSTFTPVVCATTSVDFTLTSMASTVAATLADRSAMAWSFSPCAAAWLVRSCSTVAQRCSRTRTLSTTFAVAVVASSRDRVTFASKPCQELSNSFAKRVMWCSRLSTSSWTALLSSSCRLVMSSCIVRCVIAREPSTEAMVARRRSALASTSLRRICCWRSAEARSSRRASRRFAVSMCQFHCSSLRACSASTWCLTASYRRSISARSCARSARSASMPPTAVSSCEASWWLETSRADFSA